MGRPREHDQHTRAALRDAAEAIVQRGGVDALSVRAAADAAGTTTRAVYSLFGSKDGLIRALAARAFEFLEEGVRAHPRTKDPAADLVSLGTTLYRSFVRDHPSLFRIAFQRVTRLELSPELADARARAWTELLERTEALGRAGGLAGRSPQEAAVAFNALCEGLANAELRGGTLRALPKGREGHAWRDAFQALVAGFAQPPPNVPARRRRPAQTASR